VPIAIKDGAAVAGMRMTVGSDLFGDFVPEHDSYVVRRLKEAGFVIVGRTNMPEFGILPVTEPRRFGPTRNPWEPGRTPGGSSGGAAAAVAAGLAPIAPPDEPFAEAAGREPGRLRVGMTTVSPIDAELDPAAQRAVRDAGELLASLGHDVRELETVPWAGEDLLPVFTSVFSAHIALGIFFGGQVSGRSPSPELVEPLSWEIWKHVREHDGIHYALAKLRLEALTREIIALWSELDVVLTPPLAERPVPIGEIDASSDDPWADFRRSGRFTPYTAMFNVTGQPAISVPLFHGEDGLPLGVQIAGPPAGEAVLLSLAAQLEAERPWADRRPALAAA
jgi:amidase